MTIMSNKGESFSKQELVLMFDRIEEKLDEHTKVHADIIDLIKGMQSEMRESNGWKNKFMGAMAVVMIVVVPILSYALYEVVHIDKKIANTLNNYQLEAAP